MRSHRSCSAHDEFNSFMLFIHKINTISSNTLLLIAQIGSAFEKENTFKKITLI